MLPAMGGDGCPTVSLIMRDLKKSESAGGRWTVLTTTELRRQQSNKYNSIVFFLSIFFLSKN